MLKVGLVTASLITLLSISGCVQPGENGEETSIWPMIIFLAVIFGLMYFVMIRPQRKKQKEHQEMTQELQRGDRIVTVGGIYGQIESINQTEDTVILKLESGATMKIARGSILGKQSDRQTLAR